MAEGQLPLYYKNSKLVGATSAKTKWSEYYLLVVTMFGFLMLFAGILWFLPSIDADDGYTKAYDGFTGTEPLLMSALATESILTPLPNQKEVAPTLHSNIKFYNTNSTSTASHSTLNSSAVFSNKPSSSVSSSVSSEADKANARRRKKVVQVSCVQFRLRGKVCGSADCVHPWCML